MNIEAVSQKAILLFDGHGKGKAWKDRITTKRNETSTGTRSKGVNAILTPNVTVIEKSLIKNLRLNLHDRVYIHTFYFFVFKLNLQLQPLPLVILQTKRSCYLRNEKGNLLSHFDWYLIIMNWGKTRMEDVMNIFVFLYEK